MQSKYLGVVLALAVALIGGPTTPATAQPLAPTTAVNISTAKVKAVKQTSANLNLRIAPALKAAAEKAAADDQRSLSSLIEKLLTDHVRDRGYNPQEDGNE